MENQEWMSKYISEQAARNTLLKAMFIHNKSVLLHALADAGITSVEMQYDGMGDNGCLEKPEYTDTDGNPGDIPDMSITLQALKYGAPDIEQVTSPMDDAVENLAYDALAVNHPGWEINDGSFGTFRIDVEEERMTLICNVRTSEYCETEIGGDT